MAFFALLWKARTIEKYRVNYEKEKINSIVTGNKHMEQTLSQRWRYYKYDVQMRVSRTLKTWYPDGSGVSNFFLYLKTDQTFPNFLFKSVLGFVGGIILTYLCFMFFVFQLSISLIHATIMSSIIGVLLTLGLAFSYRIRCLVFLLIPQFFSRVGRYTLTCYALVLILTGPATNTLKNSEVLSESMACSQEQIKTTVHQLNDLLDKPYNSMKDALQMMMERFSTIALKLKETIVKLDRLVLSLVGFIQSSFSWLQSVADMCNAKLGTPYERCLNVIKHGLSDCKQKLGSDISVVCNVVYLAQAACHSVKPFKAFCCVTDFMDEAILASVRKKLKNFTEHLRAMFYVEVHIHQSYSFSSNTSRSASQVAAGIVTEIRNRADPLLTWLSWSSCVTSLFLLLIIFRAKYYQHMYETRSRFDNRYVTKDLQELDLKRQRQGRETVLPLNRRERAKYITTTSFRLVASEKVYLNRSAVFMAVTTFKLLIHMVADYSLYWVLMTIRYHGRYQSDLVPGLPHSGIHVSGTGFVARLFRSIAGTLDIPLMTPVPSPISCLPDPYPPDLRRYTQIGVLIFLLWFFALFEPYGLRLRHLIMGHYRPERAKARATWLYNHILRTRAGFMKFARRKLHKEYKYSSEASLTLRNWMSNHVPLQCLRSILGIGPKEPHCLLCGTTSCRSDPDSQLTRCHTPNCPGTYCMSCYTDIGQLCTICLSPADYGDLSDVSLEKGSSDDSDSDDGQVGFRTTHDNVRLLQRDDVDRLPKYKNSNQRWKFFTKTGHVEENTMALLPQVNNYEKDFFSSYFQSGLRKIRSNIKTRNWDKKYTYDWIAKLTPENMCDLSTANDCDFYPNIFFIDQNEKFEETIITKTKSIGINTDKNRGMFMSSIVKRFTRRKTKKAYASRHTKNKSDDTVKYETLKNGNNEEKLINIETSQIIEYDKVGPNKRFYNLTKNLHTHNLAVCQRNFKKVMRGKIDRKINSKIKIFNEIKSMITAIKNYLKSNERIGFTTQINEAPPYETTNDNNGDIDKPIENTNQEDKDINQKEINEKEDNEKEGNQKELNEKEDNENGGNEKEVNEKEVNEKEVNEKEVNEKEDNEKEVNEKEDNEKEVTKKETNQKKINKKEKKAKKAKKIKNPGVLKGTFKAKSSRHRVGGIQAFFSKHWNIIKNSLLPCTQARVSSPMLKEKKNHKRRKKRKCCVDFAEATIEECYAKKDNKHTRNLRISAFLAELEWTKRDYKKENDGNIDSFFCTTRSPAPITTNKIVGMVQLKNLPFQWREATRKSESCKCKEKSCNCEPHSDKYNKILGPISKLFPEKMYAKKALERFRNKINTAEQPVASSLVKNMMNTMNTVNSVNPEESGIHNDSSICLSKRASYYRSFTKETIDNSDIINTDTLFKNENYMDDIPPDISNDETAKVSSSQHHALIAKHELIVSHSSKDKKGKPRITRRCRCDFYDDLQRRWTKVKKTMSDKGFSSLPSQTYTMRPDRPLAKARALIYCEFKKPINIVKELCSSLFGPSCTVETCPNKQAKHAKAPKEKKGKKNKKGQTGTGTQTNLPKNAKKSQMASQTQGEKDIETQVTSDCDIFKGKPKEDKSADKGIKLEKKVKEVDECEKERILPKECDDKQKEPQKLLMTAVGASGANATVIVKTSNKCVEDGKAHKSVHVEPDTVSGACQAVNCPNYCHRGIQYDKRGIKDQFKSGDSSKCVCDELVGSIQAFCTCATQHVSLTSRVNVGTKLSPERIVAHRVNVGTRQSPARINTVAVNHRTLKLNKKTQYRANKDVSHKGTVYTSRKNYGKKDKDLKLPGKYSNKLSLEGSMCAIAGKANANEPLQEGLTDTGSETSATATMSARSDGTKTDTTICSLATNFDDTPRRRKFRVKVVTKTNQATITDKTRLCDTGTITSDWWSPIIERKAHDEILLEKKKGYNTIERQKRELREYKELKELRDVRKRRRNCGVTTDGRIVTFRSRTQIIPTGLFAGTNDVMSPSRYLLESQKYYNELFSYNFRPPSQMEYACVTSMPKYQEREKIRSPLGSRRNHYHKTKRLEECYSPRRQASPRKRYMDPVNTKPYESPRRRSHTHRHSKNRHYPKNQMRKQY